MTRPDRAAITCIARRCSDASLVAWALMWVPMEPRTRRKAALRRTTDRVLLGPGIASQDRRNALMLQTMLAVTMIAAVAMAAYSLLTGRNGPGSDTWGPLTVAGYALACLWLTRSGRYRLSAALTVCGGLVLTSVSYALYGLQVQDGLQMTHLIPLLFAGLLLGRTAVWWTALASGIALALGARVDLARASNAAVSAQVLPDLLLSALNFLVLAVILDRLILSSQRAIERSNALDAANAELEREIEENERAYARLLHTQRMEAIGRLSAGAAHDFSNILHVILGLASAPASPEVENDGTLAMIRQAAQRGAVVTRRLLSFSRKQERHVSVFDLAEAVAGMRPLMEPLFHSGVQVRLDTASPRLFVEADRDELELALLNMASNASDAMPEGGRFGLAIERDGDHALIRIEDTGTGMTDEVRERLFESFFTTKPRDRGTGIGMTIVKRFVADSGGRIDVDSAPGRGTRIHLRLPLAAAGDELQVDAVDGLRVLLVTSDDAVMAQAAQALRARGCHVDAARHGDEALACALHTSHVDVVIADQDLPDVDGATLLWQLGNVLPRARRMLLSDEFPADLDELQIQRLPKPFDSERLLHTLRDAA
jgi:signal transduction histidine kinase